MLFSWWRPRHKVIDDIYENIKKEHKIQEQNMYSYPVSSYRMDVKCSKCDVEWHSVVFSRDEADEEQSRIQAQYKKHLHEFHADKTN